jgi:hypothetical protein
MRLVERQERTVRMPQDSEMGKSLRAEIGIFFVSPFFIETPSLDPRFAAWIEVA